MSTVSINAAERIIEIIKEPTDGILTIDVRSEFYSVIKNLWGAEVTLQGLKFPLRPVGGDTVGNAIVGPYVFVNNFEGWRIRPYAANHEMILLGNIFAESNLLPLWEVNPGFTVVIAIERSAQALTLTNISTDLNEELTEKIDSIYNRVTNEPINHGKIG